MTRPRTPTRTHVAITTNGRKLAAHLGKAIGVSKFTEETCSLICRHAATHHHYAEAACNRELLSIEELRYEHLEELITDLVDVLPETEDGPFVAYFQHDPRGATVKIMVKGHERHWLYNGFALEAIIVPTER